MPEQLNKKGWYLSYKRAHMQALQTQSCKLWVTKPMSKVFQLRSSHPVPKILTERQGWLYHEVTEEHCFLQGHSGGHGTTAGCVAAFFARAAPPSSCCYPPNFSRPNPSESACPALSFWSPCSPSLQVSGRPPFYKSTFYFATPLLLPSFACQ